MPIEMYRKIIYEYHATCSVCGAKMPLGQSDVKLTDADVTRELNLRGYHLHKNEVLCISCWQKHIEGVSAYDWRISDKGAI